MGTECSWRRKREGGEILGIILYWAGWCVLAANVCFVGWALVTQDIPEKGRWQIVMLYARAMVQGIFGALVLFGISAVLRATNANTREIRKLIGKEDK
ncbi:MAG: hypothetical protein JSW23_04180 [Planctomycetota bacterium]|nr:MAG: hypothetical protein JSW23_04180 [Planctomycetota bacterium]